jgi:glutathione S-transferase
MMKLYFHPLSGNSRRVLLVATHLDVPLERVVVDLTKGEQREAPHLQRNPNGRVPVLDDDGFVLWESRAIMQYLAENTPGQTLLPADPRGRAEVNRWMYWCAAHMAPANTVLVLENFVKARLGQTPDPAEIARGEKLVAQCAPVLDAHLAGRTWVAADRLTLADFSLASSFALAGPARLPIAEFANLRAWLGRVQELDAWQRTTPQTPQTPPTPPAGAAPR